MNKPRTNQPETPYVPQGRDLFQTPNYAVDLLVPFLRKVDFTYVWDCACGEGRIVERLKHHHISTYGSDIRKLSDGNVGIVKNFLDSSPFDNPSAVIVTNPPIPLLGSFIKSASDWVALLLCSLLLIIVNGRSMQCVTTDVRRSSRMYGSITSPPPDSREPLETPHTFIQCS